MFAIVDIETTGGFASANAITEIAIVLHNGKEEEGRYQTLVNPGMPIQKYVQSLTGITDAMVAKAPQFNEVAPYVFNLLKDRVFVAHNVNFDYSFVKHHLQHAGYELNVPKLCTIRLTKKIFPSLPKYGLETVCRELNISNQSRHRAMGDAAATSQLFRLLVEHDRSGELTKMMKGRNAEQYLPPNLDVAKLNALPYAPGVYYFCNKKGKVIYVGKAKSLRKRVVSHFANNKPSQQKQAFLAEIYDIRYEICSSELMASLLESIEIKRLWPPYNKSQKVVEHRYGIYLFEDIRGYLRLGIDKKRKFSYPLASFTYLADAHRTLWRIVKEFNLHPGLCFLDKTKQTITELPEAEAYNQSVNTAITSLQKTLDTYLLHDGTSHYVLVENGVFYGMGFIQDEKISDDLHSIKPLLTPYPENEVIRSTVKIYAERYPWRVKILQAS
ncbi:MAG: GIY-YIG nuclease family protein [Bacteroidota bacterium]|nr:GIY-YIG nuclease family protein [Bacteroidota bacterium]